ncbi:Xaa-Pro peptidase family protein [Citreicella sp. C3M06]|uniref:M24 family metallopeptidase n=1 Tax=Citreicella sp. C3M06 TaxID=2841564 RepID=UPI001C0A2187|nr:Xaa-Pro peptidase family protein [Citreicella sp. C3M06]MBU2963299.1 Xaa-Pro peptidase family protein [Citreicella sp. C3M06]
MSLTFSTAEFTTRLRVLQQAMTRNDVAAVLLTQEPDIRYFSGFLTRFWESPTRPWFLVIPAAGQPIAVIPDIGRALMARGPISDIRSWPSPDYADDGLTLLADTLREVTRPGERIGVPMGRESTLRMPLMSWDLLRRLLDRPFVDVAEIIRDQQMVKSPAEIALIETACAIAGRAFARVPQIAAQGTPLCDIFRRFQSLLLDEGADWVGYVAGGAAQGGYNDVISPAAPTPLVPGDILMLDTGAVHEGYYCDFNRNWSVGPAAVDVSEAHEVLHDAAMAAFDMARPGIPVADLHAAMLAVLAPRAHGPVTGRLGHGLGMRLTEPPSLIPDDRTLLRPGMVLTVEPCLPLAHDRLMVHEENMVITEDGARWLSPLAPRQIPVV